MSVRNTRRYLLKITVVTYKHAPLVFSHKGNQRICRSLRDKFPNEFSLKIKFSQLIQYGNSNIFIKYETHASIRSTLRA